MKSGKSKTQGKTSPTNQPCILLAEDDKEMRTLLARAILKAGYEVTECPDGFNLLDQLASSLLPEENEHVDLIISDIRMPGATGLEVLEGVQKAEGFPPIILITSFGDEKIHAQAEQWGAAAIFDKPFDIDELLARVHEILNG